MRVGQAINALQLDALSDVAGGDRVSGASSAQPVGASDAMAAANNAPLFGLTDKTNGRTGYFEYKLDDQGRIWTRYNPVLAKAPFELPVTEASYSKNLAAHLKDLPGPYSYTYDSARGVITVTPKPNASQIGLVMRGGRLQEVPMAEASAWQLHDGNGGPQLSAGGKLVEMKVSSELITARGSDGILYEYKPTVPDNELPPKWSSDLGCPFGGQVTLPDNARDWTFGVSMGVKPSERPTFEVMNPYTDIDNYYTCTDGTKVFYGFTATTGVLTDDGRQIRYRDTGLPPDFDRGFLTPERGQVVGSKLQQDGSNWLLLGHDPSGKPSLWLKAYDHEMLGTCPGVRYTFDSKTKDKSKIYDLAEAQRYVPLAPWQDLGLPPLIGKAVVTDRMSIHSTGQGDKAREICIEGCNANGVSGVYFKRLGDPSWSFSATGKPLLGTVMTTEVPPPAPMSRDFEQSKWDGFKGAPLKAITLEQFHPLQTLDEAATLSFTLQSGQTVKVLLRTADAYTPLEDDKRDDRALNAGVGEEKVLTATLEIPPEVASSADPQVRAFVQKYLQPYHHVPNLFVLTADIDHVDLYNIGRFRKTDKGFDYGKTPECEIHFTRDATGESDYERRAAAPGLAPTAALSKAELDAVIDQNQKLRTALGEEVSGRRWRHAVQLFKNFWINVATKVAFFFLDLTDKTEKPYYGPITDLMPRNFYGSLRAHDLWAPASYQRALATIDHNIAEAKRLRVNAASVTRPLPQPVEVAKPAAILATGDLRVPQANVNTLAAMTAPTSVRSAAAPSRARLPAA